MSGRPAQAEDAAQDFLALYDRACRTSTVTCSRAAGEPLWPKGCRARARIIPMYRVGDIQAAVQRVRAAGGTSTDPTRRPYGISAECADDQGTTFYLGQF